MNANASVRSILLLALLSAVTLTSHHAYCAGTDESDDLRYEIWKAPDGRFRFDKKTGEVARFDRDDSGVWHWVHVDVVESKDNHKPSTPQADNQKPRTNTPPKAPDAVTPVTPLPPDDGFAIPSGKKKSPGFTIEDEQGKDITDEPSDFDRTNAANEIAAYADKLSLAQAIKVGEKVKGTILLRNTGPKKLQQLEVSVSLRIHGKEKPEYKRYLYTNKPGAIPPPQPNGGNPVEQVVDFPAPPAATGDTDVVVTFIKFTE